jgi:hypothetical protein
LYPYYLYMENTTNINDLPIDTNPPSSMELPEQNLRQNPPMDDSVYLEPEVKKRVRFSPVVEKSSSFQEKHKILLLATLFFLLFSDIKVKNYLMNILVVIFGDSLRTSAGGSSKIGQVAYSILYGTSLVVLVSFIDLSTLSL